MGRHREHGQEAVAGFRWEVITRMMVGQWRWRQDTQGNISGPADGMSKGVGQRETQGSFWFEELEAFALS